MIMARGIGAQPMRVVDLFAGLGGFSEGARQAGMKIVYAANHCPTAVDYHARNHPETFHECQDLRQADFTKLPEYDVLLASPCCQGHSKARGNDKKQSDASRATAFAVIDCVDMTEPEWVIVENVDEFRDWRHYDYWLAMMQTMGYDMTPHIIDAARCGTPQNRKRLFLVGRKGAGTVQFELPDFQAPSADDIIDWTSGKWSKIADKAPKSQARIANGRKQYGDRFIFSYYGSTKSGRGINRPIGTLTTKSRWGLVDGDRMRMLSIPEAVKAMGFPDDTQLPTAAVHANRLLGNAVCPPVAKWLCDQIQSVA